jgi:hypothetical protein
VEGAYQEDRRQFDRLLRANTKSRLWQESWLALVEEFVQDVNRRAGRDAPQVWEGLCTLLGQAISPLAPEAEAGTRASSARAGRWLGLHGQSAGETDRAPSG